MMMIFYFTPLYLLVVYNVPWLMLCCHLQIKLVRYIDIELNSDRLRPIVEALIQSDPIILG